LGTIDSPGISFALSLVFLVGMANAMNLLDGMNGLATSVAAVAALSMAGLAVMAGQSMAGLPLAAALALAGACLGFLPYNYPRARTFMGDVGSLFLGFVLAGLALLLAQRPGDWPGLLAALLVLALPLTDTALAIVRRLGRFQDVFGGDREHIYDLLSRRGLGDAWTVVVVVALGAALGGGALWVVGLRPVPASVVVVGAFAALVLFAAWLGALGSARPGSKDRSLLTLGQMVQRYGVALVLDALVVAGSYYAAMLLRIGYGPDFVGDAAQAWYYLSRLTAYMPFVASAYLLVNGFLGLYGRVWQYATAQEALSVGIASAVSTAGVLVADLFLGTRRPIPLSVVVMGGLVSMLGFLVLRYRNQLQASATRLSTLFPAPQARVNGGGVPHGSASHGSVPRDDLERESGGPARPQRTLIVGARRHGQLLAAYMFTRSKSYLPVGFVDDGPGHRGMRVGGLKVLGDWPAIPDLVRELNVDLVVIALSGARAQVTAEIVDRCVAVGTRVKILPDVYQDLLGDEEEPEALLEVPV
jgi:UDP-GlcNAc:undecaprenyl-phosphate GlcNAc-1-phosphate transferase